MGLTVRALRRTSTRRGLLGGSRGWMAVFVALTGGRLLRKAVRRTPQLVTVERLEPGQSMTIRALEPTSRRSRRRSRPSADSV
jgi:hypothetical protein